MLIIFSRVDWSPICMFIMLQFTFFVCIHHICIKLNLNEARIQQIVLHCNFRCVGFGQQYVLDGGHFGLKNSQSCCMPGDRSTGHDTGLGIPESVSMPSIMDTAVQIKHTAENTCVKKKPHTIKLFFYCILAYVCERV